MRRFIIVAALAAPLAALGPAPSDAQRYHGRRGDGYALIDGWFRQFLRRPATKENIPAGDMIDDGRVTPEAMLAGILASPEYYNRAGNDRGFIRNLFTDLAGRRPSPREAAYWFRRLLAQPAGLDGRIEVASEMLQRFPQRMSVKDEDEDEDYHYRRPYYRDHAWRERERDWRKRERDRRGRERPRRGRERERDRR
jgi:hypothetical protein